MPSLICPKCKQQIETITKKMFCSNCGTKMTTTKCLVCNRELKLDEDYCTQCGAKRDTKKAQKFTVGIPLGLVCFIIMGCTYKAIYKDQQQAYYQERNRALMNRERNRESMEQILNDRFRKHNQKSNEN